MQPSEKPENQPTTLLIYCDPLNTLMRRNLFSAALYTTLQSKKPGTEFDYIEHITSTLCHMASNGNLKASKLVFDLTNIREDENTITLSRSIP